MSTSWVVLLGVVLQQVLAPSLFAEPGNDSVAMPDFRSMPIDQAVAESKRLGLKARVNLGKRASSASQSLKVYEQMPAAKTRVTKGAEISLLIFAPGGKEEGAPEEQRELTAVRALPTSTIVSDQIDPRTGLLMHEVNDLAISAGPVVLEVRRTLLAEKLNAGVLGKRWRLNWERKAYFSASIAIIDEGPGMISFFAVEPQGAYRSFGGETLVLTDNLATRTLRDGAKEYYDASGRLIAIQYRNGNKTVLRYDQDGNLTRVEGPFKSSLQFESEDGRLMRITASNGAKVEYQYDGDLAEDDAPATTRYSYGKDGRVAEFIDAQTGATQITYDKQGRVTRRRWADGGQEEFAYDDEKGIWKHTDADQYETITNWRPDRRAAAVQSPDGSVTIVHYDDAGRVIKVAGASGKSCVIDYDNMGRVQAVVDSVNGVEKFEYLGDTQQISATVDNTGRREIIRYDPQGNVVETFIEGLENTGVKLEYNDAGLVSGVVDAAGAKVTMAYDDRGRLIKTTDNAGVATELVYDEQDNLLREITAGNVTERKYDARGRIIAEIDPAGAATQFVYNDRGLLSEIKGPRGGVTRLEYDARGRRIKTIDPLGRVAEVSYTKGGRVARTKTLDGEETFYKFDSLGNPSASMNAAGGGVVVEFDADGNVAATASSTGPQHAYKYSATGNLLSVVDRNNVGPQFSYDIRGHNVTQIDPSGAITRHEYDKYDRLVMTIPSRGAVVRYQYGENGDLLAIQHDEREAVRFEYDEVGRKTRETYASGRVVDVKYDKLNHVVSWSDNLGRNVNIDRDPIGRPLSYTDATGAVTKLAYDEAGNLTSLTDPVGKKTAYAYNLAGELTKAIDAVGNQVEVDYNPAGKIATTTNSSGGKTRFEYDQLGNPVKITGPNDKPVKNTFDPSGRIIETLDAKGQAAKFAYNDAGLLESRTLADGTTIQYAYNKLGLVTSVDDGKYPVVMEYDAHGNRTKVEYPAIKRKLIYEYDEHNRLKKFVDSEGNSFQYEYDQDDRVTAIVTAEDSKFTFAYDSAGRKKSVRFPNGVRGFWNYNAQGRIAGMAYLDAKGKAIEGWKYAYDPAGNLVETTDITKRSKKYQYDAAGQLIAESNFDGEQTKYAYSPGGNRARREAAGKKIDYRYNQADELVAAGKVHYQYDANGNLVEERNGEKTKKYVYDTQNQLIRVELPGNKVIEYGYSPTGERIWRKDAAGKTWYVTDGVNSLAELTDDLSVAKRFVHAPGIDQPLAVHQQGQPHYLLADQLGSVTSMVDQAGQTTAHYEYDAFGQIVQQTGESSSPFSYTAREYDEAAGLYYYRARFYDAQTGRFLSVDSAAPRLQDPLTLNPYLYARNNPLRYTDPMGADWEDAFYELDRVPELIARQLNSIKEKTPLRTLNRMADYAQANRSAMQEAARSPTAFNIFGGQRGMQFRQRVAEGWRAVARANPDILDAAIRPKFQSFPPGFRERMAILGKNAVVKGGDVLASAKSSLLAAAKGLKNRALGYPSSRAVTMLKKAGSGISAATSGATRIARNSMKTKVAPVLILGALLAGSANANELGRTVAREGASWAGGAALATVMGAVAVSTAPLSGVAALGVGVGGFLANIVAGSAAGQLGESLYDRFFSPGRASQKMAQLMAEEARRRQLANAETDDPENTSELDDGFIAQDNYATRAKDLLAKNKPKRNYRELAEGVLLQHNDANNTTFDEYLKKAGQIERQLVARDRAIEAERQRQAELQRQAEIAAYNQRVAAARAAQAAQLFQSLQQQNAWNPWAGNQRHIDQPVHLSPGVRINGPVPTWNFNQ